ncbi:MAG TPA: hypothetical protein VL326_37095 [Kofleriaceae bacterium]|nr:hypothetical protein [Kofleriaceae bacterium]
MSDTVTFEIPPLSVRLRAIGVFAIAFGLQAYALTSAPWFTAKLGDKTFVIELARVRDMPDLTTRDSGTQMIALIALLVFGLAYFVRSIQLAITMLIGHPTVRRGLFGSRLIVAWKTPLRAQIHTGILTVLTIVAAVSLPQLAVRESYAAIPGAEVTYSWGGAMLVFGCLMAHGVLYVIARDPQLAATQMWGNAFEAPAYESAPALPPKRRERPMIKPPLPPAPTNVEGAPFREPGSAGGKSLESLLVRPKRPSTTPDVKPAADGSADEPSLLR